jgi:parvulin-like peptidyl-prolyl isomerase
MQNRFWRSVVIYVGALLLVWRPTVAQSPPAGVPITGIAAVVNDHVITFQDVQIAARRAMEAAVRQSRMREDQLRQREKEILRDSLDQLIDRRLILDEFITAGYNLPDSIINDVVQSQIREEFGDRVTLMKTLRKMGQTFEDFREDQRDAFIIHSMTMKNVNQNVFISPRKIELYYEANTNRFRQEEKAKIRMIVIDKSRHALNEPDQIAAEVQKRVAAGEDFAKLADEFSDDARRFKGGDRGWVEDKDSDLRKELRKFVFSAKPGEVSPTLNLDGAEFIVKVEERKEAGMKPLSEARLEIEQTLKTEEMERLRKQWIAKLRKKSFISYFN